MAEAWRALRTDDGSWTLAHPLHGATCHSTSGAWQQACERYAAPCRLRELARDRERVRLLDVGTGLGLNFAAALAALDGTGARLAAVSLERDPHVIRAALALADWPREVERWYAPVRAALARALAAGRAALPGGGELELVLGDARESLARLEPDQPFDAVFFDPFAPQVEPELWSSDVLARVAAAMAPQAVLSTYSSALAVRAALARAGLHVGVGPRVGAKSSGTLASAGAELPALDARTSRRVAIRSTAPPDGKKSAPGT